MNFFASNYKLFLLGIMLIAMSSLSDLVWDVVVLLMIANVTPAGKYFQIGHF